MSRKHFVRSPRSLLAALEPAPLPPYVGDAVALLMERELFGMAWLDASLVTVRQFGTLAHFATIGQPITETVLPLFGLEDELNALKSAPASPFEMPNVSIARASGEAPRYNLQVYWLPAQAEYLLLVLQVTATSELEIGLAQQVRARMIVEAELAQKSRALAVANEDLTRANRDLAEFAYVISHDLKAPLRAMRYFAEDLEAALAKPGAGDPHEFVERIKLQSRRMTKMMNDLLAYSKIGRQFEALEQVDTAALVRGIAASMPRGQDFPIEITGDWPILETYAAPLDLVLRNLIANAIAHHDRSAGRITVDCRRGAETFAITVADDGPGIPVEWQEAIFQPFKTIHASTDGSSSGIGLALVRRTAETVGAVLRLESDPSIKRGSRFKVDWPLITQV